MKVKEMERAVKYITRMKVKLETTTIQKNKHDENDS